LLSIVSTLWYNPNYVDIRTIEDLESLYQLLKSWKHDFESLIIDSLTEINEMIKEWIEKDTWRKMQIQDWGDLFKKIKWIIRWIKELPMNVIIICQEKVITDGDWKIQAIIPMLNGKNATEIAYMMDIVAHTSIDKDSKHRITTKPDTILETKDRTWKISEFWYNAPNDFKEWIKAMASIDASDEEVKKFDPETWEELTPEVLKKREEAKAAAARKKKEDELKNVLERIEKADQTIEKEEFDRQNGEDNPTDTDQFRKAQAALLAKIQKYKAARLKLVDRKKILEIELKPEQKTETNNKEENQEKETDSEENNADQEQKTEKELTTKEKLAARSKKKKTPKKEESPMSEIADEINEEKTSDDHQSEDTEEFPREDEEDNERFE